MWYEKCVSDAKVKIKGMLQFQPRIWISHVTKHRKAYVTCPPYSNIRNLKRQTWCLGTIGIDCAQMEQWINEPLLRQGTTDANCTKM